MRLPRAALAALVLLGAFLVVFVRSVSNDARLVGIWAFLLAAVVASAVALVVVLARVARGARRGGHGASPARWWSAVLAAAFGGLLVVLLLFVATMPLPPGAPRGASDLALVLRPRLPLAPWWLLASGASGLLAAAAGTRMAGDGTRTRVWPVVLRMALVGMVPPLLLALSGWFVGLLLPLFLVGALVGMPLLAAYWTDRLRAPGDGRGGLDYAGPASALAALWLAAKLLA